MNHHHPDEPILTAKILVEKYQLLPHPEGGYFLQTYRSDEWIASDALPGRFGGDRFYSTAIYFLLESNQFSSFHRIKSDELWHFYYGAPLEIFVIYPDGRGNILKLGSDVLNGYSFQLMVPAGCWFAARPAGDAGFSFVGCTVAPGFDFADFELANRATMLGNFPQHADWIRELT